MMRNDSERADTYPETGQGSGSKATTSPGFPGVSKGTRWREGEPYASGANHPCTPTDWLEHGHRRDRWMRDLTEAMPTLRGRLGDEPWTYDRVEGWLVEPWARGSTATKSAIAFVLMVWTGRGDFVNDDGMVWSFDACEALGAWDRHHRAVFVAWARSPWWL